MKDDREESTKDFQIKHYWNKDIPKNSTTYILWLSWQIKSHPV